MNLDPFSGTPEVIESLNLKRDALSFNDFPFIIPLNKPVGITSFDCIRKVRPRIFSCLGRGKGRRKLKIGHFGTLDPFADGVLLIGTGKAMKLMNLVQQYLRKEYRALAYFGEKTITGDLEGEVIESWGGEKGSIFEERLLNSIHEQVGILKKEYLQVPPYFSAVKHEGRPLYEYARKGIFIDKPAVKREIYSLKVDPTQRPLTYSLCCSVSSGTYIRGLWQDLLVDYQKTGHLKTLSRSSYGSVKMEDCIGLEEFCAEIGTEFGHILPWDILKLPEFEVSQNNAGTFLQGGFLPLPEASDTTHFWLKYEGHYLGLAESFVENGQKKLKAMVNFY